MIDMFPEPATGKPAKAAKAVPAAPAVPAIPVAPPAGPDSPAENPEGLVSLASMLKPVSSIAREAANQVPLVRETFSEGALAGMARPPKPVDFSDIVGFGPQTAQDADIYRDFTRAAANNANNSGTYLDADNNPVPLSGSWYDTFEGRTMGFNDWKYSSPVTKDADGKWVDDSTWNPVSGYLRKFDDEQNFSQLYPALDADGNPTLKQFIGTKAQARQAQVAALNTFGPAELNDGLLLSFAKGLSNTLASTDDILIGALKMRSTGHRWFNKAVLGAMGHSEEESDLYSRIFAFDKFADDKLAAIHQNILDDTETNSYTGSQASENFGSLDWLSGGVAAAAGSLLQFGGVGRGIRLATGIANYGAKTLGTELLKREAASLISTYGSSAIIGFGAGYNEGKTNGLSDNEAFAFALPVGLINTVLEAKLGAGVDKYLIGGHKNIAKELFNETGGKVADKAALGKAINKVSEKLSASIAKDMAKDTGQNVAEEVLQEMNGQLFRSAFNAFLPGTKGEGKFRESGFDGEALASAGIFGGVSSAPMSYLAAKSEARSFGKDPDSVISGYVEQGQSETLLLGLDTLLAKKLITPEQHKEKTSRILDYRNVEQEILSKKINFGNEYSSVLKREFTNLSVEKSLLERQKMSLLESAAEAMAAGGADAAKIKRETTAKIAEIDANLAELSVVIPLYENPAFIAARTKKVQAFVEKQRNDNPFAGRTPFAARIASLFAGKAEKVAAAGNRTPVAGMPKTVVPEAVVPDISTPEELRAVLDAIHGGDADAAMLIDVEWLNKNPIHLSDMFDDRDLEELGMMGVLIPVKPTNAATPPVLANDIASQLAAAELAIEKKRRASLEKAENDSNPRIEKWKKTAEEEVARMGKLTLATDNTIGALTGSLFNEKERINERHDKELSDLRARAAVAQAAVAQAAAEKAAAAQAAAALAATPRPLVLANAAPQAPAPQAAAPQTPVVQTPVAQAPVLANDIASQLAAAELAIEEKRQEELKDFKEINFKELKGFEFKYRLKDSKGVVLHQSKIRYSNHDNLLDFLNTRDIGNWMSKWYFTYVYKNPNVSDPDTYFRVDLSQFKNELKNFHGDGIELLEGFEKLIHIKYDKELADLRAQAAAQAAVPQIPVAQTPVAQAPAMQAPAMQAPVAQSAIDLFLQALASLKSVSKLNAFIKKSGITPQLAKSADQTQQVLSYLRPEQQELFRQLRTLDPVPLSVLAINSNSSEKQARYVRNLYTAFIQFDFAKLDIMRNSPESAANAKKSYLKNGESYAEMQDSLFHLLMHETTHGGFDAQITRLHKQASQGDIDAQRSWKRMVDLATTAYLALQTRRNTGDLYFMSIGDRHMLLKGKKQRDNEDVFVHEFFAEALSNREMMNHLSAIRIDTKDAALSAIIGSNYGYADTPPRTTLWNEVVKAVLSVFQSASNRLDLETRTVLAETYALASSILSPSAPPAQLPDANTLEVLERDIYAHQPYALFTFNEQINAADLPTEIQLRVKAFNLPSDGSFDSKLRTTLENAIGENFVEGSFRPIFFRATNTYMVWWKTPNADGTEDTQRLFIDSWGNAAPVNTNVFNREDPVDLSKPAMYEPFLVSNLNNPYWEDKRQVLNDFDRADKEGFVGESWLRYDADHEFVIGQGTAHQKLVRGQVSIMYRFPDNSVAVIGYVNDLAKIKLGRLLAAGAEVKLSLVRRPTSIGSTLLVRRDAQGRITGTLHRNSPMAGYRMETGMFGMVDIRYISTTATKAMSDAGIRADPLTHLDPKVPIVLAVEREPDMTPGEIIEDIAGQNGFAAEEPPNEEAAVTDFVLDNAVAERLKNNMEIVFRRARHRRAWFGLEENDLFDYIQNSGWAAIEALKKQYVPIYGEQIAAKLDYFGFTPASYQGWVRQATDRAIRETVSANQFQDAQDWDGDGFNPINTISPLIRFDIERLMYADPKDGRNRIMDFSDASDLLYEATSFAKDMEEVVTRLEAISADPGQSQRQRNIALALARNYSNQLFHEKIPENERAVFAKAAPSIIAQMGSYRRSEAIIFQPDANSNGVRSFYPNQSQETSKVKEELARGPEAYVAMLQARAKAEGKKASGFLWTITNKIFGLTRDDISGDDAKEKFSGVKVLRLISRYLNDETLLRQEGAKAYFDSLNEKERRFMSRFVNPETGLFVETADKDGYNELAGLLEGFLREVGLDEFPFHLMERQRIDDNEAYIKRETEAFKERMSLKNSEEYQEFLLGMPTEEEKTARQKAILVEYNRKMLRFRSDVRQKSPSHTYRTTVFSRNLQQGDDKVKTASLERSAPVIELAAQTAQFLYTAIEKIAEGENTTIGRRVGELVAVAQTVQDYRSDKQTPAFYLDASQTKRWSRRIRNWTDDLMHRLSFNTGGLLSAYRNTNMYRDNNLVRAIANSAGKPVDAYFAGLKTAEGTDGTTYTEMDDADYLYSMLAGFVTSPGRYWHFDKTPSDKPGNYMYRLAKIEPRQYAAEVNKLKDMEETRMERASARFSEAFRPVYQLGENGRPVRDPETKAFIFERYEVKDQNALESMVEDADYTLKDGVYGKGRLHDRSKYWYGGGSTQEVLAKLEAEADMFYRMLLDDGISIPVSQAFENEHNPYMTQARAAKEGVAFELEEKVVRNYAMNLENERKSIARQWYVNQTINQFHVSMVIQGDPLYYKGAVDGSKRMAGARAPFQHSNAEGTFNMAALRDIDRGRTDVEFPVLSINDDGSISISAPQKVAESNRSDAQGYVTEDFAKRLTEINGSLAGYGNVFKPIQFGIQPQHLEDARPTYLKLSMFVVPDPYKPEHAAYYQSQPGMLGMAMKMYSVDGPNPVDIVLFESGIKTGISNLSNHSDAQWKTQPMSLSMFGFQNNPRHLTDDHTDISGMSQGKKISHNMSPRLSLEALEIESKIIRAKMEAAFETFTPEGVAAIAKDSLSRQRHTAEMAKVLDSGISVDNPVFGVMVENLVNARLAEASSYVRLPGNKLVNASEVGFQRPALTPEQQQRYEAVAKAIGDTVLRWAGPRKPDGLLPFQLEEFSAGLADGSMQLDGDGTILGIDPDTKSFVPVIYPAEVLVSSTMGAVGEKIIAMRIPTSGPQSIIPCVIAGHLPPELVSGNIIVSPSEGPGLLGFDFDVDGLGTWRRSGNAQMNKLFDLYYRMYTNPRVYSDITSPIDTGIFDALLSDDSLAAADNESRLLGRQSSEWDDSSPMKQIMFRNLNSIGKIFIGISAVANNIHNILSGSKKNGHTVELIPTRKKKRVIERTIRIAGENAGSYESHYTDLETGEVKPIAPILVSMINLATDNAKLQKLFRLGLTLENAAVFFDFVLKGIDPKAALYFINQPIVRQFEKASMAEKRMSSKYAGSDPYRDMVAMYEREMEVLTGNEYTHVSIFDNPRYQIDKDISYDDLKRMLAMDNDAREQKAPSPLTDNADYIRMQLLVLDKYRYYQRLQNKTKKIGSIIRMDSTYPKTFLQAAKRYQDTLKSFQDTNFKTLVVSQKPEDFEHFDKEDWRSRLIVKQILDEMNLTKAHPILEMHYEGLEKMIDRYSEIKIIASHEVFHHLWPYISSLQEGDQVKVENALKANVVSSFSDYNNRLLGKQMDSYHFVDQSSRMIAALVNDPEYADNSFLKLLSADIMFEPDHERIVSQQSRPSSIKANTIGREFSAAEIERLHADYYALPTAYASGEFDSPLDMQKILVANMLLQKGLGMGGFSFTHLLPIPIIQELDNTVKDFRNSHPGYQNLFAGNFADRLLGMFQFMQIDIKPDQVEGLRVALTKAKDKTDVDVSKLVDGRGNRNFNILWDNWPTNRAIRITNRDGSKSLYQRTSYLDFDDQTGSVYMVHKIVRIAMPKQYFVQEIPIQESLADWTERWNERQKNWNAELVPDGNSSIAKIISSSTSKEETEETDDELMSEAISRHMENRAPQKPQKPQSLRELQQELDDDYRKSRDEETREIRGVIREREEKERREEKARVEEEKARRANDTILKVLNLFTTSPIQQIDFKKSKAKASVATKYVGFGNPGSGISSTHQYMLDAGEYANTGSYAAEDIVFLSVSGNRKSDTMVGANLELTKSEIDKVIAAGARIVKDNNRPSAFNTGEQMMSQYLVSKGYQYSETSVDGQVLGLWSPPAILNIPVKQQAPVVPVSPLIPLSKEQSDAIKYIFKQYPELESLFGGEENLYQQYIESIFPSSKIKDIVYRADKRIDLDEKNTVDDYTLIMVNGVFYSTELGYAESINKVLNGKIYPTLVNLVEPIGVGKKDIEFYGRNKEDFKEEYPDSDSVVHVSEKDEYDENAYDKYGNVGIEIVVFEPEQIHILGGKRDLEQAQRFVAGNAKANPPAAKRVASNPENAVPVRKPSGIRQISKPVKSSKKTEFTGYRRKERKTTISGYRLTIPEFPDAELYLTKEFVTQDSVEGSTEFNGKTSYWEIETRTDKGVILPIPVQGRSTIEETIDGFTKYINELHSRGGTDLKALRSVGIDLDEYDGGGGDGGNVLRFSSQPLPGDVDFDEDADAEDGVRILEYYAKVVGFAERDTPMDDMSLAETVIRYRFGEAANAIWAVNSTFDPNTVYDVNYINFGKKPPAPYTYQEMIDEMMGGYRAEEAYLFDLSDRINNQDMLGTDANGNYITSVDDLALLHSQLAQNYNTADGLAKREFAGVFKKVADELAKRRVKRHVTYNGIPQELVENQRDLGRFSDYTTSIAEMSGYQLALQASSKMVDRAKYLSDSETNKTVGKLRILLSDVYKAHFASQSDAWHRKFAFWNNHNRHNEPYLWLYEKDPQGRYTGNFIQRTSNGKTTNEFMQMERQSKLNTVEGELARAKLALYSFLESTGNDLLTQNDYTNVPTDRAFMPHLAVSMEEAYARNGLVGAYMEAAGVNDYNEVLDKVFVTLPSGTKVPSGTPRTMALGDYRAIFLDGTGTLAQQRAKALSHMSLVRQAQELVSNGTSGLSGYDMERLSAFDSSFATHSAIPFRAVMRRKNFSVNTTQILTQHFTQLIFKKHHDPVLSELQAVRMHYEMKSKNPKDFENISKFIELYSNRYLFGKKDAFASSTAGKMLEVMSTVTTASFLGFAPANAALNLLGGAMEVYKNNIENYGWAEGTTRFAIGQKRLFEKGTRKPNDATDFLPKLMFSPKALALAERYNLENFSQIDTEQEGSTWATYTKFALQIQRSSEIAVRLSAFLGELTQAQWDNYYLDNNGILQVTNPAIAPKIEDVNEWKYYVSTKQGFYDPAQKYNYSYYGVAKGVMLFKNWVLSYMKERFYFDPKNGQANYSDIDRYGKMRQGYYITLAMVAKDLAMQVKTFRGVLDKSELNAMEAANLRKCLFDLGMLVTLVALGNLGDDDEEDGYWTKFVNKLNSQLYFALIPSEWVKMVKQPTPSLAIVENILSSVSNLAQGKAEKTAKNLMNAIPGGNLVEGAIELQESLQED